MARARKITTLEQLLDRLERAGQESERVPVSEMMEAVGRRSFGPLLLLAGLLTLSPVGDIPGVPTLIAMTVFLVSGQLLLGRERFWFPQWLLQRSVSRDKLGKGLRFLRKPARFVDRFLHARLCALTHGGGVRLLAAVCVLIALAMPPMEFVPFTATGAGAALTLFGLALVAHDGALALIGFALTATTGAFVLFGLL